MILVICSSDRGAGRRGGARARGESSRCGRARLRAHWWRESEGSCLARGGRVDDRPRPPLGLRPSACGSTTTKPTAHRALSGLSGMAVLAPAPTAWWERSSAPRRGSTSAESPDRPGDASEVVTRSLRGVDAGPLIPCLGGAPCPCPFPVWPPCWGLLLRSWWPPCRPRRPLPASTATPVLAPSSVRWLGPGSVRPSPASRRRRRGQPRAGELWAAAAKQPLTDHRYDEADYSRVPAVNGPPLATPWRHEVYGT